MLTSLFVLVLGAVVSSNNIPAPPPAESAWEQVANDDGVEVWARSVPNSPIREVKAVRIIETDAKTVWEVIADIPHYTEFMPYVLEARTVAKNAGQSFDYFRINPPIVNERDYTLRTTVEEHPEQQRFVRRWSIANHQGPPPRSGTVRLQICDGSWTVEGLDSATRPTKRARVTYWLYTDPAGSIPSWLANRANKQSLPDLLNAISHRSLNPNWRR
jgi:hypothetical protein